MNSNFSNLVKEERPDYKAYNHGLASLNVVDLISLVIQGSNAGTAQRQARQLVNICGGSLREMANRRTEELEVVQGMAPHKALALKAALELAKRLEHEAAADSKHFGSADAVWRYFRPVIGSADHEEAHVLLMNNRLNLIKAVKLSSGGLTETAVDVRVILHEALLNNATTLTLVHNHPSGNNQASRDDDAITAKLQKAAETMRIYMVDHVIVTATGYYSYREEGKM